ncbi:prealbumin-like fold domain-containing protein [Enterococcus sp. BWT-B8]|uniref:MSCRAMM family protein n=1 Tax=Enterococcus sp. BWT-B8 TaxID=2885157 RepID=UPI00226D0E65
MLRQKERIKEITGQSSLTKVDKDTGTKETQGKALLKEAEYTLYYKKDSSTHKAGDPVKWADNFKPELVKGIKKLGKNITLEIGEENQVAVKHLAINDYYWQETKSPEGYLIDQTRYDVSIKKVDDSKENAVITKNVVAKEQVIRFNFDFFKFTQSATGSASTGFNDLTFKVTPLDSTKPITGAKDTATTEYDPKLGFDGYGKFEQLPYGDYKLKEVEAPAGFQKITPLLIHSTFKEDKQDYSKSEYVFTITEKGQKEPIKTVKVPYEKMTNTHFSVQLNRLLLYDFPEEENALTSLATWKNNEKELTSLDNTELIDQLSYKLNKTQKWFVVSKAIDVEATKAAQKKDKEAEPVVIEETSKSLSNSEKTGTWTITHKLTTTQALTKQIVLFNYIYESEEAYKKGGGTCSC